MNDSMTHFATRLAIRSIPSARSLTAICIGLLASLSMGLASASSASAAPANAAAPAHDAHGFTVNQFVLIAMEYTADDDVAGIDTYGPTASQFRCTRAAANAITESEKVMPKGHRLVTTCLHVMFGGPLPHGVAAVIPSKAKPLEYITVGVEYAADGHFVGAQALHPSLTVAQCMNESHAMLKSNYSSGRVHSGRSLILYCVPVPVLDRPRHGVSI